MATSLRARLDQLADAAGEVTVDALGQVVEYSRGGRPFAVAGSEAVELRLMPDIAEAARRTPDTASSTRGEDWVLFAPQTWDDHAADRLEAWFRVAWRLAGT
jgi:hypothetical protein